MMRSWQQGGSLHLSKPQSPNQPLSRKSGCQKWADITTRSPKRHTYPRGSPWRPSSWSENATEPWTSTCGGPQCDRSSLCCELKHMSLPMAQEAPLVTRRSTVPVPSGPLLDDEEKQRLATLMQYRSEHERTENARCLVSLLLQSFISPHSLPNNLTHLCRGKVPQVAPKKAVPVAPKSEREMLEELFEQVVREVDERKVRGPNSAKLQI